MDWPTVIKRLTESGWTQTQLAERCNCAQSTISDLANDKIKTPSYAIGKELEVLVTELDAEA